MTTYRRADGELIHDQYSFVTTLDTCPRDAETGDEPSEYVEEVWVLQSSRTLVFPLCAECDAPATHWGLCEPHAREDASETFEDSPENAS